jgi:hypothetical protein
MNLQTLQSQLNKLTRRSKQLHKTISTSAARQYAALPTKVGLKSIDALVEALIPYTSPGLRKRLGTGTAAKATAATATATKASGGKSKGTRYGADVKAKVIAALREGKQTAASISATYGPSVFSINAWKANLGLTKKRKKTSAKAKTRSISKPVRY